MKNKIVASMLAACFSAPAFALPEIESGYGLKELNSKSQLETTAFTGSVYDNDENVVYFPYSKVEVVKDAQGIPKFQFAYSPKGALMTTTLRAIADFDSVKSVFESTKETMVANGIPEDTISWRYLPVLSGFYTSTLKDITSGAEFVIGTNSVESNIPTNQVALSVLMGRKAADLVVLGLESPYTALGFNYQYTFAGRTSPYRANITIDWRSVYAYLRAQFGFRSLVSAVDIDVAIRYLRERKDIEIEIIEGDQDPDKMLSSLISDITKIVIAKTFKAHHPKPQNQKLKIPKRRGGVVSMLASPFASWAVGVSAGFSLESLTSIERVTETYAITSVPRRVFTATAGGQLPGKCDEFPSLFAYAGKWDPQEQVYTREMGCPPGIYPDRVTPPPAEQIKPDAGSGVYGQTGTTADPDAPDVSEKEKDLIDLFTR